METALPSFLARTTVLIPAFNEEAALPELLAEVRAQLAAALTLPGEAARGREVFTQRCFACHRAEEIAA